MKISSPFTHMKRYLRVETGMAAVEFAFILPFMLLLYFGLMDLTGLISANRKMTSTASIVADLVGQNANTITKTKIADYMKVSEMINKPAPDSGVTVRVINFRKVSGAPQQQWTRSSIGGPGCGAANTTGMVDLMAAGNDVIVAQACMTYAPYIASFMGEAVLGKTSFTLQQDIVVRPRSTNQLACTDC